MGTMLRMVELDAGTITIDGIDIANVRHEDVRQCLTTMPQETFFTSGTVRQNLDPLNLANDESLIRVLEDLALGDFLDAAGGLDADLRNDVLSLGQQRLFSLARAVVRGGPVLLLDEATSRYEILVSSHLSTASTNYIPASMLLRVTSCSERFARCLAKRRWLQSRIAWKPLWTLIASSFLTKAR